MLYEVIPVESQLYAAAGYVVVYLNPRGSDSYGAEFVNLIHYNYPSQDYDDLMTAVDTMIGRGVADPDQLYVTGGRITSYNVCYTKLLRLRHRRVRMLPLQPRVRAVAGGLHVRHRHRRHRARPGTKAGIQLPGSNIKWLGLAVIIFVWLLIAFWIIV